MSFLAALVKQSLRNKIDPQEVAATALVLQALHEPSSDRAYDALVEASDLGVDLCQVGALALVADTRSCADLLKDRFGISVEEYRSTGEEGGMDCQPGYPLLAALAYARNAVLQRRALAWGANPAATWQVDHEPGDYKGVRRPFTISWASQVIRSGDTKMADEIMTAAGNVDIEEQVRRFSALLPLRMKIQDRNDSLGLFRDMLEMLAPTGAHALGISPWDIPDGNTSIAASLVGLLSGANTAFNSIKALGYMMPWIQSTALPESGDHLSAALACISPDRHEQRFPQWCVEQLTPRDAGQVLNAAWPGVVSRWITANHNQMGRVAIESNGQTGAHSSLVDALRPLSGLVAVAMSGASTPEPLGSPRHLIGCLDLKVFSQLDVAGLDAIEALIPVYPGSAAIRTDVHDLRTLFYDRQDLRGTVDGGLVSRGEKEEAAVRWKEISRALLALHASCGMEVGTSMPLAASTPHRM